MMTTEAEEMRDNMGISDKFRGGDMYQTTTAADIWDNGDTGDGDTGRWKQRHRQRRRMGGRINGDGEEW